jgi:hypothetical protein
MNHLSEEQLIEHHYGGDVPEVKHHLAACEVCAEAFALLRRDLAELKIAEPPVRSAQYGEQVWRSLANSLPAYPKPKPAWQLLWTRLGYAAVCALLIAAAFLAGRRWERRKPVAANGARVKQQVVVVVLGDYLDRSERLLVELKHADAANAELVSPLRDEAQTLLPANRRCRETALQIGDPALAMVLEHLDRVLAQLAGEPGGLSAPSLARLQTEMNTDGLLFQIRVLRAQMPDKDRDTIVQPQGHYEN